MTCALYGRILYMLQINIVKKIMFLVLVKTRFYYHNVTLLFILMLQQNHKSTSWHFFDCFCNMVSLYMLHCNIGLHTTNFSRRKLMFRWLVNLLRSDWCWMQSSKKMSCYMISKTAYSQIYEWLIFTSAVYTWWSHLEEDY